MTHFKHIGLIILRTTLLVCCGNLSKSLKTEASYYPSLPSKRSLKLKETAIVKIGKLHPFEILFREAISYADITLQLVNNQDKTVAIAITNIEIVDLETDQVLLSDKLLTVTRQPFPIQKNFPKQKKRPLQFPESITLAPKEKITLNYRLKSPNKLYQKGKQVYTKVYYRQDQQLLKKVIYSEPENVAFTIP